MAVLNASLPSSGSQSRPVGAETPQNWLFGPKIDTLGLGGLTFIVLGFFLLWNTGQLGLGWVATGTLLGSILVNYPHYAATYHRVYRNADGIRRYPLETVWITLLLLVVGVVAFYAPPAVAGWYCAGYIFFAGWHYSGQSYGIALIYARKNGFHFSKQQKLLFLLPLYLAYLFPIVRLNSVLGEPTDLWGVAIPTLGFAAWVPAVFSVAFYASFMAYMAFTFYIHHTQNRWLPGIVQVVVFSHLLWFSKAPLMEGFMNFVPFFHCLQYLLITAYFHYKEHGPDKTAEPVSHCATSYLKSRRFLLYYLLLLSTGAMLFMAVPQVLSASGVTSFAMASAIVVSFLNMHHFVLDGAIWKLRRQDVNQPLFGQDATLQTDAR